MLIVSEHQICGVSGRFYREFQGEKFWFWPTRGIYGSQVGGKTRLLHLEIYRAIHGEPNIRAKVECVDGNMCNTSPDNWIIKRSIGKRLHRVQEVDGIRFYVKPEGYYKADHAKYGGITMHRYVWEREYGTIGAGLHVHHVDGDKSNNDISNLELLTASDHSTHHGETNPWVGSEANKRQLAGINHKAKAWHSSPEGVEWHKKNGVAAWANRKWHVKECTECGKSYETPYPSRSKYCHKNCKAKANYRIRSNATSL